MSRPVTFKVTSQAPKCIGVVPRVPEREVAVIAEDPPHLAGMMIVVNMLDVDPGSTAGASASLTPIDRVALFGVDAVALAKSVVDGAVPVIPAPLLHPCPLVERH